MRRMNFRLPEMFLHRHWFACSFFRATIPTTWYITFFRKFRRDTYTRCIVNYAKIRATRPKNRWNRPFHVSSTQSVSKGGHIRLP